MITITVTETSVLGFYALAAEAMSKRFQSKTFVEMFNRCAVAAMLVSAGFTVYATSQFQRGQFIFTKALVFGSCHANVPEPISNIAPWTVKVPLEIARSTKGYSFKCPRD